MSKNIALDLRLWRAETAGVGRYQRNLLTELLKLDKENHYTAIITPQDDLEFTVSAPNLTKLVVPAKIYSPAGQLKLLKVLNQGNFDLVHFTHFDHPLLYRRPFVVTVHDMIMHFFPPAMHNASFAKKLIFNQAYRLDFNDCKRAKKIIVPSSSTKNDLLKYLKFDSQKVVITPEGSEDRFKPHSEEQQKAIRQKLGLPDKYLLFVSRWEPYKGLPALLEAYELVKKSHPDIGLVILGKPDKTHPEIEEAIREKQKNDPKVITPGFVSDEDLEVIYSAATVYIHPSWYEGFGIMILEAFASGVPVVTSNVSSLPEVVGDAGLLIDPRNPQDIAEKVSKILDDPTLAKNLITKGLERVKQYSWKKMAEETLNVYQEVLGQK